MKVLITNTNFETRGGSQGFVRCLANALEYRGHSVLAYANDPEQSQRLLANDLLPIALDIENLPFVPDIIHAQHHLDAMPALTALPDVPGNLPLSWRYLEGLRRETSAYLPVLVMSRTSAHRISVESNISPDDIEVFPNAVDLERFKKVRTAAGATGSCPIF